MAGTACLSSPREDGFAISGAGRSRTANSGNRDRGFGGGRFAELAGSLLAPQGTIGKLRKGRLAGNLPAAKPIAAGFAPFMSLRVALNVVVAFQPRLALAFEASPSNCSTSAGRK